MDSNNPYQAPQSDTQASNSADETYQPKIISIQGRIGRLRYLSYIWLAYLPMFLLMFVPAILGFGDGTIAATTPPIYWLTVLFGLLCVAIFAKRRLNDMNLSGWFALGLFVPLLNLIAGAVLVFGRGTTGNNKFGPAPCPNPLAVKITGLLLPLIMLAGIIAAIVLPAYSDYVERALQAEQSVGK